MADPAPTQVTQYQTGFAPEIAPYAQQLLGAAAAQIYNYERDAQGKVVFDATGMPKIAGMRAPETYTKDRIAQFTDLQKQAFAAAEKFGPNSATTKAAQDAAAYAAKAAGITYSPGTFSNQFTAPDAYKAGNFDYQTATAPNLNLYQIAPVKEAQAAATGIAALGPAPTIQAATLGPAPTMQAATLGPAPEARAVMSNYAPQLQQYQMDPAERVTSQSVLEGPGISAYMSPYMQNVVEAQMREAQRQADIAATARGARYAQAGAYGGARQAIENAEAARNLALQKGDIQAAGLQTAYGQAQQQFNAEQQARMQAALANQQAGLTVGQQNLASKLGIQQLATQAGLQTSLANQQAANAIAQSNAQLAAQYGLNSAQFQQAANQANQQIAAQFGLSQAQLQQAASIANQQTAAQYGIAGGQLAQSAMNTNAQLQQQANLANQQMAFNTAQQNLQAQLGTQQLGANQSLQAQLANQQAALQAQQQREQASQFGYGQQMQAAQTKAQYGQAAQQLQEQSSQFGAGLGLQGLQAGITGAQAAGNLGNLGFGQQQAAIGLQNTLGGQQQAQVQNVLSQQYQDFLNQQNLPFKQVGFMSDVLRGAPLTQTGSSVYSQPPSMLSQLGGLGATAIGAFGASGGFGTGKKAGGRIRAKRGGGLSTLALAKLAR